MNGTTALLQDQRPMLGIALMLLVYFLFSTLDASVKWLGIAGLSALQIAFMRYFGHFIISLGILLKNGVDRNPFASSSLGLVILRGALLMGATVTNFLALQHIPLTVTSTIMFTSPIVVCALSGPLLGERVGLWRWMAILVGLFGAVIAIRPFDASFHLAVLLSIASVTFYSLYAILTRKLVGKVSRNTLQFYSSVVGTFVLLPFGIHTWKAPASALEWFLLAALGVLAWLGHELLTRAHSYSEANALTPYTYVFIVYMTAWGYILFDHIPDRWTILGAIIVISAGLVIWLRERKLGIAKPPIVRG
ncbi:MAG: DMT family transporter [Granulosicoccus sp.]|nr:DMT family transporter [Granulosicoccus sp.]